MTTRDTFYWAFRILMVWGIAFLTVRELYKNGSVLGVYAATLLTNLMVWAEVTFGKKQS